MGRVLHFLQLKLRGLRDFELGVVRAEARRGTQLLWTGRGRQKMEPGDGGLAGAPASSPGHVDRHAEMAVGKLVARSAGLRPGWGYGLVFNPHGIQGPCPRLCGGALQGGRLGIREAFSLAAGPPRALRPAPPPPRQLVTRPGPTGRSSHAPSCLWGRWSQHCPLPSPQSV